MSAVHAGRYTADPHTPVTVFLIGMRINRLRRVDAWLPTVLAMPRMLVHLEKDPESGYLGQHSWFGRTTLMLSYWRSADDLIRFAADTEAPHAEAWRAYQRRIGGDGTVGVWHETYTVRPGEREAVYANMPRFGLAKAIGHLPVGSGLRTAKQRLRTGQACPVEH